MSKLDVDPRLNLVRAFQTFVLSKDSSITLHSKRLVTRMLLEFWLEFPEIRPAPHANTRGGKRLSG